MVSKKHLVSHRPGVLLCAAASLLISDTSGAPEEIAPTREIEIAAAIPEVAVVGLPYIAEIFVINHTPDVGQRTAEELLAMSEKDRNDYLRRLRFSNLKIPDYTLFSEHPPPISVGISDRRGNQLVKPVRPSILAFHTADWRGMHRGQGLSFGPGDFLRPHIQVRSGDHESFLLDLAPWLGSLKPGDYELTITVYPGGILGGWKAKGWDSKPVRFRAKTLDAGARAAMREAIPAIKEDRSKPLEPLDWLDTRVDFVLLRRALPVEAWTNVSLYAFLADPTKVRTDVEILFELVALPEHLQGLADLLLFESLLSRGDETGAAELQERILEDHPTLKTDFDRVRVGTGLIQQWARLARKRASEIAE